MKIAICDDEEIFREQLWNAIIELQEKHIDISIFENGETLLAYNGEFDLIFLDIEMHHISGIDVKDIFQNYRRPSKIVFVTSHYENMPDAFGENVLGFLLKPIQKENVWKYISFVRERLAEEKCFFFQERGRTVPVKVYDILYMKAEGKYTKVFVEGKSFFNEMSLSDWENQLDERLFCRVHRSFLVNFLHCQYYEHKKIMMIDNGDSLPIARQRLEMVKEKYFCFLKDKKV